VGVDRRSSDHTVDSRRKEDYGGRPFRMFKFRTMRVDAEPDGKAVWATPGDSRVTPIGEFLRRTRLDELPQSIPEYPIRQRVKPGITGWAQINQSYDSCLDDVVNKVKLDLEYLTRQC